MPDKSIVIKDLRVEKNSQIILKNVNLKIEFGDFVYLFGANGSGKSTLVKAILRLDKFQNGSIRFVGQEIDQQIISHHFAYVPQYSQIERDFPISVEEMISIECDNSKNCDIGVRGHLSVLNLEHLLSRRISDLSGGEFQKVLIARALTSDPDILILDEPVNNLDEKSQKNLMQFIFDLNEKHGKTIILISHDLNQIISNPKSSAKILLAVNNTVQEITTEQLNQYQQSLHIH